jgi:glycosidase
MQRMVDTLREDSLYPRPDRLVTFIGNHDQSRVLHDAGGSLQKVKAGFSLLLTLRGVPEIYAGDEIAMDGGDDPDNRRDFPGGFPLDPKDAFKDTGRTPEQQEVFRHVQALLHLRKEHPALRTGTQTNIGWDDNSYAFVRATKGERMLIIFNNKPQNTVSFPVDDTPLQGAKNLDCVFGPGHTSIEENMLQVTAPSGSVTACVVN